MYFWLWSTVWEWSLVALPPTDDYTYMGGMYLACADDNCIGTSDPNYYQRRSSAGIIGVARFK